MGEAAEAQFHHHVARLVEATPPAADGFLVPPASPAAARRFLRARKGAPEAAAEQYVVAETWRHSRVRALGRTPPLPAAFLLKDATTQSPTGRAVRPYLGQTLTSPCTARCAPTPHMGSTSWGARCGAFCIPLGHEHPSADTPATDLH